MTVQCTVNRGLSIAADPQACPANFCKDGHLQELLSAHLALDDSPGGATAAVDGAQQALSVPARRLLQFLTTEEDSIGEADCFEFGGEAFGAHILMRAVRRFLLAKAAHDLSMFIALAPVVIPESNTTAKATPAAAAAPTSTSSTNAQTTGVAAIVDAAQRTVWVERPGMDASVAFRYELRCLDFDCKPAAFIPKYAEQDRHLCQLCLDAL